MPTTARQDGSVALVNVPIKVGPRAWRRCLTLAAQQAPIAGLNESLSTRQRRVYRRTARRLRLDHFGLWGSPNPVFWERDRYKLVEGEVVEIHPAGQSLLARQWPGFNADRSFTDVVLESLEHGGREGVIVPHLVPEGPKVPDWWRAWARRRSVAALRKAIRRHLKAGRPVWVIGDTNVAGPLPLGVKRFRWIKPDGIDKAGLALPRGTVLVDSDWSTFKAPTDHHRGVAARASWRSR